MKLYMKQHIFTWGDRFSIYDAEGNTVYSVQGEIFTLGKKLHVYDQLQNEVALLQQELFTFFPKYRIYQGQTLTATVEKQFAFFRDEYTVDSFGWFISGDVFNHEYSINKEGCTVASVYKEWFTLGDAYAIDIASDVDPVNALAVALVIDAVISARRNN